MVEPKRTFYDVSEGKLITHENFVKLSAICPGRAPAFRVITIRP